MLVMQRLALITPSVVISVVIRRFRDKRTEAISDRDFICGFPNAVLRQTRYKLNILNAAE